MRGQQPISVRGSRGHGDRGLSHGKDRVRHDPEALGGAFTELLAQSPEPRPRRNSRHHGPSRTGDAFSHLT